MDFLCYYCFIVHTVQESCRLSPIEFTPPDATKLDVGRQCELGIRFNSSHVTHCTVTSCNTLILVHTRTDEERRNIESSMGFDTVPH